MAHAGQSPLWHFGPIRDAVSSSLRITLALIGIMAASLAFGQIPAIAPLLLGAIASGLAETDDNWRGRLVAQSATLVCFTLLVGAVQFSRAHPAYLLFVLVAAAFFLTLLGALGERYRAIATATLIMSLYAALALQPHVDRTLAADAADQQVILLLAGAAWHGLISVAWAAAFSRLPVEQDLARLYSALSKYLDLKSKMFEPVRDVDRQQRRLALALHNGQVVDALNAAKESLFSRRQRGKFPDWLAAPLHQFFVAQDVHERTSSSHESYELLADQFFHSDVLYRCERVLALIGMDCARLADAIRKRERRSRDGASARALEDLDAAIAHAESTPASPPDGDRHPRGALLALRALAANLSAMDREIAGVWLDERQRMPADTALQDTQARTFRQFGERLRAQMTLDAPLMRHAIRLSVALAAGYALMLATGDAYGVWILLTIVFVCQPRYAATLTRLFERIAGTLLGLFIGWALLKLFPAPLAQAAFVVAAAVLFFILRAERYLLATAAITAFVLLSFNQVGDGFGLIVPRLLDTLAGSLIAGVSVWLILPSWQALRLPALAAESLRAQSRYLVEIMVQYGNTGKHDNLTYRIARRDAHNADAGFSGALAAAFREPSSVRHNIAAGTRLLVLSHTLLNYLSALGAHRDLHLNPDIPSDRGDPANTAAARLHGDLEDIAATLESGQIIVEPKVPGEPPASQVRAALSTDETQPSSVLHAQLALAISMLPALRAAANELLSGSA